MNQSKISFEFGVFEALNPKKSLKINNLPNKFLPKICILFMKLSVFFSVSQIILHCDLRIPESQNLFSGLRPYRLAFLMDSPYLNKAQVIYIYTSHKQSVLCFKVHLYNVIFYLPPTEIVQLPWHSTYSLLFTLNFPPSQPRVLTVCLCNI